MVIHRLRLRDCACIGRTLMGGGAALPCPGKRGVKYQTLSAEVERLALAEAVLSPQRQPATEG